MRNEPRKRPRAPRVAAVAAALTTGLVAAGCGGGTTTVIKQGSSSTNTPVQVKGPSDLAANLAVAVKKGHKELNNFRTKCPPEPKPPNFPVRCTMTAIDTSDPNGKDPLKPAGAHVPVSGTVTIYGVYNPTHSYIFGLDFAPARKKR